MANADPVATTAPTLSVIVPLCGDLPMLERDADALTAWIGAAAPGLPNVEWLLALDGDQWSKVLAPSRYLSDNVRLVSTKTACHHPGVLCNHALGKARGAFVAFAWPGCEMDGRVDAWLALCRQAHANDWSMLAGPLSAGERQASPSDSWLAAQAQAVRGYHRGWLQMQSLVPMSQCVVRRDLFEQQGGFSPSVLLQRHFWWAFTLRVSRAHTIELDLEQRALACAWGWHNLPMARTLPLSGDLAARLLAQDALPARPLHEALAVNDDGVRDLMRDLAPERAARLARYVAAASAWASVDPPKERPTPGNTTSGRRPMRIAVVGGLHEPAHNQLCFYNYFQKIDGQGLVSWRALLDSVARPEDVADCDLVIFSRTRLEPGRKLLDYCVGRGIKTLYMLDDNWLWIGRDVPETYGEMFKPGAPSYETFLHCCRTADCTLTYSPILAQDLEPHCKRLARLPTNIDLDQFPRRPREASDSVLLGYVGSTRWVPGAFDGLVAVARERPNTRLFIMTNKPPDALRDLPPERIHYQGYVYSYERYAHIVCQAAPDVLVAPLQNCRYQNSKCPNKYLEITAVGAAGVYSRCEPYTGVITQDHNGLFADDTLESWKAALLRLVDDATLRQTIAANALEHVEREYNTRAVLPSFLELLESVIDASPGAS